MGMELTTGNAKLWLDSVIEMNEKRIALSEQLNGIVLSGFADQKEIHIHEGIDMLALVLNKKIEKKERKYGEEYPYEYVFEYRGYKVFEIRSE